MQNNLPVPMISINVYPQSGGTSLINLNIDFQEWFTILCGPNGTGKSTTLARIKEAYRDKSILYNPKRNSERKNIQQIYQAVERSGERKAAIINNFLNKMFNDNTYDPYYSYPEVIGRDFLERYKESGKTLNGGQIVEQLKEEYGGLIKEIFPNYQLVNWDFRDGGPFFQVEKMGKYIFESDQLSTGEQEILSLVFNIQFFKDSFDILLIDEPEIHLNWALEENLFSFLKKFAKNNKKQIIITTHARVIFEDEFKNNCKFLYFNNEKNIVVNDSAPEQIKKEISGDVAKFVISSSESKTIFVEDSFHELVINTLLEILGKNNSGVNVQRLNGKNAVVALFSGLAQGSSKGFLKNSYFLIDGDDQADTYPTDNSYIKLSKYCLESYFLNLTILNKITNKGINTIKAKICKIVNRKKQKEGKLLTLGDIKQKMLRQRDFSRYDCSYFLSELISSLGMDEKVFVYKYLEYLKNTRTLKNSFDKKLMNFINN